MARRALRAALAVSQGGHGRLARARSAPLRVSGFCGPAQGRFRVVASTGVRTFTAPTGGSDGGDAVGDLREVAVDRSGLLGGAPRNVVGPSSTVTGEELGPKPAATELTRELCMMISMRGPITVADFMRQALAHPTYGYYMRGDVFGRAGDFTTSPEISQMFGELLGVWAVSTWHQMGKPAAFRLAEVGPGRGTLMQDLLRAVKRFPDCYAACVGVHLVETSPALQAIQVDTLDAVYRSGAVPPRSASRRKGKAGRKGPGGDTNDGEQERKMQLKDGKPVEWHPLLGLVPMEEPLLLVAQELFDALPVHQFEMTEAGVWRERLVDVAEPESRHHLRVVLAPGPTPALQGFLAALARNSAEDGVGSDRAGGSASDVPSHAEGDSCTSRATRVRAMADRVAADGLDAVATPGAKPGDAVEFSPAASALAHEVGARIAESGGAACFIDYGYDGSRGLSLRGIRDHKFVDPLSNPGDTDLSVDVNFAALRQAIDAAGSRAWGPVSQSMFLQTLGIVARFEALVEGASEEDAARLGTELRRLLHPDEMGEVYKVLAVTHPEAAAPVGFGGGLE